MDNNAMKEILRHLPERTGNFFEPFCSGEEMFLRVKAREYYLNVKDEELCALFKTIKKRRQNFWLALQAACDAWKKVEAHIYGVQDDLLNLARAYNRRWKNDYSGFVTEVGDVLERIRYSDLFGMTLPDPADFKMELRHQVLDALVQIAETDPDDATDVMLGAMKNAVNEFMSLLYEREDVETGIHLAAMVYVKGRGRELIQLHQDPAFADKLDAAHIWRYEAPTFLKKCGIIKDDFVFVRPPEGYPMELIRPFLDTCPGKWMLVTRKENETVIEMNY